MHHRDGGSSIREFDKGKLLMKKIRVLRFTILLLVAVCVFCTTLQNLKIFDKSFVSPGEDLQASASQIVHKDSVRKAYNTTQEKVRAFTTPSDSDVKSNSKTNTTSTTNFPPKSTQHKKPQAKPVKRISLIGERNSGTKWTVKHLRECFEHTMIVEDRLTRFKHWFQDEDNKGNQLHTVVVAQFRNPYDWVEAMRVTPWHASNHMNVTLWHDYVTRPWNRENNTRYAEDLALLKNMVSKNLNETQISCQDRFKYNEINSCTRWPYKGYTHLEFGDRYELRRDGSGLPYGSILELRSEKIRNFLSVQNWTYVKSLIPVRYEALLREGTLSLIEQIQKAANISANETRCAPLNPQPQRVAHRPLDPAYIEYMTQHVNWEAESLIGYLPKSNID